MLGELNPVGGGDPIPLLQEKLLIGRRSRCDITLRFPNVSSHHCQMEFSNGYWRVTDLGSRNGVKVNGERVESKWLMPGDVLHVAKHKFEISYVPTSDGPPPEEASPFDIGLLEKAGIGIPKRDPRPAPTPPPKAVQEPVTEFDMSSDEDLAASWLLDERNLQKPETLE